MKKPVFGFQSIYAVALPQSTCKMPKAPAGTEFPQSNRISRFFSGTTPQVGELRLAPGSGLSATGRGFATPAERNEFRQRGREFFSAFSGLGSKTPKPPALLCNMPLLLVFFYHFDSPEGFRL
jgi:hypothetical protein